MKPLRFSIVWLVMMNVTYGVYGQPLPPPQRITDATQPITIEWMYKEAEKYDRGLPSSESWSTQGHSFAYLIASVTEPPDLIVYDPVQDATQVLLTPQALGNLISLGTTVVPVSATASLDSASSPNSEIKPIRITGFEWMKDDSSMRLHTEQGVYLYDRQTPSIRKIEYPDGDKNDVTFSPDGKFIAYTRQFDLYAYDFEQRREIRLTHDGNERLRNGELDWVYPEELEIRHGFSWSPDSHAIVYLQQNEEGVSSYPITDFSSPIPTTRTQIYPKAGTRNPSVRVGVVRLSTLETRWLDLGYPYEYVGRMAWAPDGNFITVQALNREQNRLAFVCADPWDGSSWVGFEESDPYWINLNEKLVWLEDTEDFLWLSERDGYRHIYRVAREGKTIKQLTKGDWEVTRILDAPHATRQIFFEATKESPLERHIYSISWNGGRIQKLSEGVGTHSGSVSKDGRFIYDRFNNTSTPQKLTIMTAQGSPVRVLGQKTIQDYQPYRIDPPRFFTIAGEAGRVYHAQIYYPHDFDSAKKYPLILNVYGGPHAQMVRDGFDAGINQVWIANGFIVVSMDNRGSWGRGHAWETPVYRHFGETELSDQLLAVDMLKKQSFVDPNRIGIWGWSFGGYMTCYAMVKAPDVFRAGAAVAPVTDWKLYDTIYTERYMGHPDQNPDGYHHSSPVYFVDQLKGALLIAHGISDDNVHIQNTYQMIDALLKAKKNYQFFAYPQKDHGIWGEEYRIHLFNRMLEFFKKEL